MLKISPGFDRVKKVLMIDVNEYFREKDLNQESSSKYTFLVFIAIRIGTRELSLFHKLYFLIPISLQPNVVDLKYCQL